MTEYAVIIAAIAIGCLLALLFLSGGIGGLFGSTTQSLKSAPLRPPSTIPLPTSIADCQDEGWKKFPTFDDEEECIAFVEGLGH